MNRPAEPLHVGTLHVQHVLGSPVVNMPFKTLPRGLHHLCNRPFPQSLQTFQSRPARWTQRPSDMSSLPTFPPSVSTLPPQLCLRQAFHLPTLILQDCFPTKSSEQQHLPGLLLRTLLVLTATPSTSREWPSYWCVPTVGLWAAGGQGSFHSPQSSAQCLF